MRLQPAEAMTQSTISHMLSSSFPLQLFWGGGDSCKAHSFLLGRGIPEPLGEKMHITHPTFRVVVFEIGVFSLGCFFVTAVGI